MKEIIILTKEEYSCLKDKAEWVDYLVERNEQLKAQLKELEERYARLLVFGVASSNERLKRKK